MASVIQTLYDADVAKPPSFLPANTHYEVIMGSEAYGVADDESDADVYGFCIPPKELVFPHLAGNIPGFGRQVRVFEQYQEHRLRGVPGTRAARASYDVSIYSIVRYFSLCMENNPNMIDSLFVPQTCVLHCTHVGNMVREKRRIFLHKGCWHKFKGYAYSQLHKMSSKSPIGKRAAIREKFGFDVKFAYHVVRLLSQVEQILVDGDLDLQEKGRREHMKAIRRGEVSEADIRLWAAEKERQLESAYSASKLPYSPDEAAIKALLLQCLEHHYGSLAECVPPQDAVAAAIREVCAVIDKNRHILAVR